MELQGDIRQSEAIEAPLFEQEMGDAQNNSEKINPAESRLAAQIVENETTSVGMDVQEQIQDESSFYQTALKILDVKNETNKGSLSNIRDDSSVDARGSEPVFSDQITALKQETEKHELTPEQVFTIKPNLGRETSETDQTGDVQENTADASTEEAELTGEEDQETPTDQPEEDESVDQQ